MKKKQGVRRKQADRVRSGAQCIVDGLAHAGVEIVFGLPGGSVLDLFARLYHAPYRFVLARHEQGAAHMADGYSRATGRIGCCIVTSGPGATNAVTGLATANMDGIPMVCVSGQVPSSMIGNDAFQEADTVGITRAVTKHNYLVRNADDLPRIVAEAFAIAGSGKPGPVLIDVPKDIQQAKTTAPDPAPGTVAAGVRRAASDPDDDAVERLAEAIAAAKKPLLYVGGGVISAGASDELRAFARHAGIPVTTTLMGLGAFPETDPLALRMLGMHGSAAANRAVSHCDLLIAVGARFDDRVTGKIAEFAPRALKAHIDIDPCAIDKSVRTDFPVLGDARRVLRKLRALVKPVARTEWLAQVQSWRDEFPFDYDRKTDELLPQFVIESLYNVTNGDAVVCTDVGQHQMWAAHFYPHTRPRSFISSGGLGTMGFGMPAAIGAQFGLPRRTVVDIAGDGSIQMNFQELVVAVEHNVPVKIVILNNGYLGMVRQWQEMFYKREYSGSRLMAPERPSPVRVKQAGRGYLPDFVKLAEAHGAAAVRVTRKQDTVPALKEAVAHKGPVVVECMVRPEENVYPMVPPGASLMEMIHSMA